MYVWDQFTLPIHDFRHKRIWNKDMQFPDLCLTLGGITTGIQILRHVIIYRISSGLPLGTSNTDTWRLKPSTRCQLLVDRSELCTNVIFNFLNLFSKRPREKKKEKKRKKKKMKRSVEKMNPPNLLGLKD